MSGQLEGQSPTPLQVVVNVVELGVLESRTTERLQSPMEISTASLRNKRTERRTSMANEKTSNLFTSQPRPSPDFLGYRVGVVVESYDDSDEVTSDQLTDIASDRLDGYHSSPGTAPLSDGSLAPPSPSLSASSEDNREAVISNNLLLTPESRNKLQRVEHLNTPLDDVRLRAELPLPLYR
jgi:hypothetical protein